MLEIRPLVKSDVPAALRLSTQAGWNQLDVDLHRIITIWPNSCIAGWEDGNLVATGTLALYGRSVAWVGMILVDDGRRGRGHGGAILNRILEIADAEDIACTGLDATDLGLPVYTKRGFREYTAINRWVRPAGAIGQSPSTVSSDEMCGLIDHESWVAVLELDHTAVGVDRGNLLRHLAGENGAATLALLRRGRAVSAGFLHTGRRASAVGPLIGESAQHAGNLLYALVARADPARPILLDALGGSAIENTLSDLGFAIQRRLVRMFRPTLPKNAAPLSGPRVFAGAGFELG